MNKKIIIKQRLISLIIPLLSLIASGICLFVVVPDYGFISVVHIAALGFVLGSLTSALLIITFKIDFSKFILGKSIIFVSFIIGVILSWFVFENWLAEGSNIFVLSTIVLIAEIAFALSRKTNVITKICMILSSPVYFYTGFVIDFVRSLVGERLYPIPG